MNNTPYVFEVRAVSASGDGGASRATAVPNPLPAAPTGFAVAPADSGAVLSWNDPSDASITMYQYRVSDDGGTTWDRDWADLGADVFSHTVTGLVNGTVHTFELRALNSAGHTAAPRRTATPNPVPAAPANLVTTPHDGGGRVDLDWDDPGDSSITRYQQRRRPDGGNWTAWRDVAGSDADTVSYEASGLTNNTEYTFEIRAVNAIGVGAAASVTETPNALPAAPGLSAQPANTEVVLEWADPGDASIDKYQWRQRPAGGSWTDWADIPSSDDTTTRHTVTGLTNGTAYTFEVRAVNSTGTGAAGSAAATPNAVPDTPTALTAVAGSRRAELSWANPNNPTITSYEVRRRVLSSPPPAWGAWRAVPSSDHTTTSHTVTGLTAATEYEFEVRARNAVGPGPAAQAQITRPPAPAGFTGIAADRRVELEWDAAADTGIVRYQYRQSTDDGGTWNPDWTAIAGSDHTTTSHTVTGLVNLTSYTFEVRAVNPVGDGAAARTAATPSLLPAAPAGLTADNGMDKKAELEWDNPNNPSITRYEYRVSDDGGVTWDPDWTAISGSGSGTTSHTVDGLANMAEHRIELRAANGNGEGPAAAVRVTPLESLAEARDNILLESDGLDAPPSTLTVPDSGTRWASQAFETGSHWLGYRFEEASVYLSGVDRDDRVSMAIYDDDGNGRPGRRLYKMYPRYCCQNMNPLGRARTSDDRSRDDAFDEDGVADYFVSRTDPDTRAIITPYLAPHTIYHIVIDTTAGTVNVGRRPDTDTDTDTTDHGWTLGGHATSTNGRTWTPAAGGERLAIDVRGAPIGPDMPPIAVDSPTTVNIAHNAPIGHRVATVRFSPRVSGFTVETSLKEPDYRCLGKITGTDPDTGNATRAPANPSKCLFTVESGDDSTTATVKLNHRLDCNRTRYIIVIRAHYSKDKNVAPKDHSITMNLTGC